MNFKKINNLPPGCSVSDLPGFRKEDKQIDAIETYAENHDMSFEEAKEELDDMHKDYMHDKAEEYFRDKKGA